MNKAEKQIQIANKIETRHERGQLVLKSNALIQKTRYSLSLQEQKIILYIISKLEPNDEEFKHYEFDLKKLCELCDIEYNGKNYLNFKESIKNLSDKSFWYNDGKKESLCRWVEKVIIDITNPTKIYIRLDEDLKPYLLQLKNNYTIYELENTLMMTSKYSIRLYELLKSYSYKGKWEISVNELKNILNIGDKYNEYKDFRKRILNKSIEEINSYTDLNVILKPIRTNRIITDLHFAISKKNSDEINQLVIARAYYHNNKEVNRDE